MSYYQNVQLPKCPVTEMSVTEMSVTKTSITKVSFTEMSGYRVHWYDCVKRAVCSDLCHNKIILLPYFWLLSKIQQIFMVLVYVSSNLCIN